MNGMVHNQEKLQNISFSENIVNYWTILFQVFQVECLHCKVRAMCCYNSVVMWLNEIQAKLNLRQCTCVFRGHPNSFAGVFGFYSFAAEVSPLSSSCSLLLVLISLFFSLSCLPFDMYVVSSLGFSGQQGESAWVVATHRVVIVMHCSQLWPLAGSTNFSVPPPPCSSLLMSLTWQCKG